jgi:hypothetical protein
LRWSVVPTEQPGHATEHPTATVAAAAAPLLIRDDDNWHSIRCARVRDSEVVEEQAVVGERDYCHACALFVSEEVARDD